MKLFKSLLVAPATLGLLAPMAAMANEVTISDFNAAEEIAVTNSRVDGLEARFNNLEAGSFSETTTMDGKAVFTLGAVDYSEEDATGSEALQGMYTYTMNLNSSFTGDDNLYVRIKSGNHADWSKTKTYGTYLSSGNGNKDALKVDKIWYQFPVGDYNTVWVGPKIENYYMHGTTPSIYKPVTKQFTLGGNGEAYGASTDTGAGWAYKGDNGFAVSSNIGTKSNTSQKDEDDAYYNTGLLTDETKTSWATQIGYTQPNYSLSALLNIKSNGWSDTYYHTADHGTGGNGNFSSVGLRGWWRPDSTDTAVPSISVGFDTTEYDGAPSDTSNSTAYFVGLNWEDKFQADDKIGVAFGKPTTNESEDVDPFAYEVYYSFKPNDSITVTPAIFGGTDRNGTDGGDIFGAVLETTFKF
jgi:hypothetical protein